MDFGVLVRLFSLFRRSDQNECAHRAPLESQHGPLLQRCRDRWQGEKIGTTKTLKNSSYHVAGAKDEGVIYGIDGDSVPGAYDISYAVMAITMETATVAAAAPTDTASGSPTQLAEDQPEDKTADWKTEESARRAFTVQTPVNWTVQREPNPAGDNTVVTDPASGIISMAEGLNGLGGACAPGQTGLDESMTVQQEPVPGMRLASTPIGGRTPTLEVEHEGIYFSYSVNMTGAKPACGM